MKRLTFFLIIFQCFVIAQTEYVEVVNPVYSFLERMETLHLIEGYNSFLLPKTRNNISEFLKQIIPKGNELNEIDKEYLDDFKTEFEYEILGTLKNSSSIIAKSRNYFADETQRYLYFINSPGKANLFINLLAEGKFLFTNDRELKNSYSATAGIIGGEIRGTLLNKFGFKLRGTNGALFGNKQAGYIINSLRNNYKFNEKPEEKFFDETEGYLTADFDLINFKIGRDKILAGYGETKSLISNNSPMFDYVSMNINYDVFNFSYFHGKLLGKYKYLNDRITGGEAFVEEKYIAFHRLGFNLNKHADFGFGEIVVYGGRPVDFSYLNPFNFYKSAEHSNRDRDNSILFFDFNNNSIKSIKLSGLLLVDDISFSKIGSGWWGNKTLINIGLLFSQPLSSLPLDIRLEYIKIDPYVFSHRLYKNNYTNFGIGLSEPLQPNSSLINATFEYRFSNKLKVKTGASYSVHGANPISSSGKVVNVGGNALLGHRSFDAEQVKFLSGVKEYFRNIEATLVYEPMNELFFILFAEYINHSLQQKIKRELNSILSFIVKI